MLCYGSAMKDKFSQKNVSEAYERKANSFIEWIGSGYSVIVHTVFFVGSFALGFMGVDWNTILLVLTTAVSLEAIYLAIFIQMTVNRNTESLAGVEYDIDEIQEDIDEIQEDVDEISEEEHAEEARDQATMDTLIRIEQTITLMQQEIDILKKNVR